MRVTRVAPAILSIGVGLGGAVAVPYAPAGAADSPRLQRVGTFDQPIDVTAPVGDRKRLFVAEKSGAVRVVVRGRALPRPLLDLSRKVSTGSEQGLLGVAFSPTHSRDRRLVVTYTDRVGDTRVVAYRTKKSNRNVAAPRSARTLLHITQPDSNHNGGQLAFGPDGLLYVATGDGGGAGDPGNNAQDLGSPLGKILAVPVTGSWPRSASQRIPANWTLPASAFASRPPALPRIYAYGLRNPWRFTFDRGSGDLIIADVGQDQWEEVNRVPAGTPAGTNFGWRVLEGPDRYGPGSTAGTTQPTLSKSHDDGWCSITGGVVVRDRAVPALNGKYLFADFCRGRIFATTLGSATQPTDQDTGLSIASVSTFGQDGRNRVYVASLDGPVYRIR